MDKEKDKNKDKEKYKNKFNEKCGRGWRSFLLCLALTFLATGCAMRLTRATPET